MDRAKNRREKEKAEKKEIKAITKHG